MSKKLFYAKSIHRTNLNGPIQGSKRMKVPFKPTPEHPMIVSASELHQFLRCRLQWNWSKRVGLVSKKEAPPRVNGILVHAGKEGWYALPRAERTPESMRQTALTHIKGIKEVKVDAKARDLAVAMLTGLAGWVREDHDKSDRAIGKRDVYPEWEFCLPILEDKSVLIRGKVDELFLPTVYKGVLAMDETKTKNSIDFDMLDLNNQMTTYLWAMFTAATEYPELLPAPLRKRFKRFIAWRTVLRRQMPGPRVKAPLFGREMVERNEDEIALWVKDTRRTITDMLDAAIYPNKTDHCRWDCDFYNLCILRSDPAALKDVIESEYTAT
jgi:hypothetical protein